MKTYRLIRCLWLPANLAGIIAFVGLILRGMAGSRPAGIAGVTLFLILFLANTAAIAFLPAVAARRQLEAELERQARPKPKPRITLRHTDKPRHKPGRRPSRFSLAE